MTEKRFTLTTTEFDGTLSFYDAECDCETRMSTEYVLNKVEITLNVLHEENQRLRKELDKLKVVNEMLSMDFTQSEHELLKENEQLKQQLLYDGEEGVCNICKHQYLVESGKYYVAKCEKEHEECSKVSLKYCEDFEVVSDYDD